MVNTQDASVSTVIDRNFVESLPLNGRSFNTLLQLTPGVVIAPPAGNNTGSGAPGQFSIAGQRTDANNFTVDGVSANFGVSTSAAMGESGTGTAQAFSALGGTSSLVSVEALQEFRIETSSFAPEFGRAPGGQVILTTRSGENNFHGEVYEYFRNDVMDATDWFAHQAGIGKAPERHNDFGGYFGGPIVKDKTFFFFSYEGARLRLPQTTDVQVPSDSIRMSAPASLAPFLASYPLPNGPVSAGGDTAQFVGAYSNRATLDAVSLRVDHTFNERVSIFGRYNYAPSDLAARPLDGLSINTTPVNTQTLTLGLNVIPSGHSANTLRGNYSSQSAASAYSVNSFGGAVPLDPSLIFGSGPLDNGQNYGTFYSFDSALLQFGPQVRNEAKQANVVDDFSITSGSHQLKFGADYRSIFLDTTGAPASVSLTTTTFEAFVSTGTVPYFVTNAQRNTEIVSRSFSLYGQDTWKITPRLTMTYGLRWELDPSPSPRGGTILAAWENVNDPATLGLAPPGTPPWSTTYGNVAPRLGIAYSPTSNGSLVFRAGGGVFYDTGLGAAANLLDQFPNHSELSFSNVAVPVSDASPYIPVLSVNPPFPKNIVGTSSDLVLPRSYQWNAAIEKSFLGQAVSVTYVGQAGRNLLRQEGIAKPNANFKGAFLLTLNDARSNYNALQVQYRRPLSNRLQVIANYTWSHSLDNASNDVIENVSDSVISAANDYGSSDFDVRQSFSAALSYGLPAPASGPISYIAKNWSVDAVIVARSGFPLNGSVGTFTIGGASVRPDLVPDEPFYLYGSQCAATFQALDVLTAGEQCPGGKGVNPAAFLPPASGQQGNEPRNDISGFGLTQVDISLARRFAITERVHLEFRADAFNALNHPNFSNPAAEEIPYAPSEFLSLAMLNQALGGLNPLFQEGGPRSFQLSLKLGF